jgi:hypothetical protein
MGDVIEVEGWDLRNFSRNPVALASHDSRQFPIGRWTKVWIEGNKLRGELQLGATGRAQEARPPDGGGNVALGLGRLLSW